MHFGAGIAQSREDVQVAHALCRGFLQGFALCSRRPGHSARSVALGLRIVVLPQPVHMLAERRLVVAFGALVA